MVVFSECRVNLSTCTGERVDGDESEHLNKGLEHSSAERALMPPRKNHLLPKAAAILTLTFWNQGHIVSLCGWRLSDTSL